MSGESLPSTVRDFLVRYIRSLEQLEVLLLLRNDPERCWTPEEVYEAVRSSVPSIRERLEELAKTGFLTKNQEQPPIFRYAPNAELSRAVDDTAEAYRIWRVRVIETIFSAESDPLRSFSDAFRFRKE